MCFEVLPLNKLLAAAHVVGLSGKAVRLQRREQRNLVTGGRQQRWNTITGEYNRGGAGGGVDVGGFDDCTVGVRNWRLTPT